MTVHCVPEQTPHRRSAWVFVLAAGFALPPVQGRTLDLSNVDLPGEVPSVDVFAARCVPCRSEPPPFPEIGRTAIEPGAYGIPETFVVGADGRIAYKHIGPISRAVLDEKILPLMRESQAEAEKGDLG